MSLGGSDGSQQGKAGLYSIWKQDINLIDRKAWGQVSQAVQHILITKLNAVPIPNAIAKMVLKDAGKQVTKLNPDGYHYTRMIGGVPKYKFMVGNLPDNYKQKVKQYLENNKQENNK